MSETLRKYKIASDRFIELFDRLWGIALQELGEQQAQLIVGNRLRPQICLWGYLATVQQNEIESSDFAQIANVAVSIEMIHKASLLLDDWIDNDRERHGQLAFHAEYNPQYAVLFALEMIGYAMERLENTFPESLVLPHHYHICISTLIKTVCAMAKGAVKELRLQADDFFSVQKVREITQLETAEIIGNSFLLGYYVGTGDHRNGAVESAFKKIGDQCGYIFQAFNDLEAFGNPQGVKRHKGSLNLDFLEQRKNMTIAALYEIASRKDRAIIRHANEDELQQLMKKYRVVETLSAEIGAVYSDVIASATGLHTLGLPGDWCEALCWFLSQVKRFAEERLKG